MSKTHSKIKYFDLYRLQKEKTPEGGKDENVFDIQQGVGIVLLVKLGKHEKLK